MEGPTTRALAEYIAGARFSDLPPAIIEHAKLFVLDTLGVGIYGASSPWCERLDALDDVSELIELLL